MRAGAALRRAAVRRVLAAELDLVYHDPGSPNSGILVGSSGNASATALDPIAAWHWPGVLAKLAPPASRHRRPHAATGHPDSRAYPLATCTVPLVDASAALPARR
jgi:hypothetical protein